MGQIPKYLRVTDEISRALEENKPVLAMESTVITHGLPYPENLQISAKMEQVVRQDGVIPATIAVLDGNIHVGIDDRQMERLANAQDMHKISRRDFGPAVANGWSGGTTVAGTMMVAHTAGLPVFATGGIGGVHRTPPYDISADLPELARTPLIVICSGAKAILDLAATFEYLETASVPVVGFQADEFPAFYSRTSGLTLSVRAETARQIVEIARSHWALGNKTAILVVNPLSESSALPYSEVDQVIERALKDAETFRVRGQAVTPFLLNRVNELTEGRSLQANLELLIQNVRLGAEISRQWFSFKD